MMWFGKQFVGIPYVGGTLDRTQEELACGEYQGAGTVLPTWRL